MNLRSNVVGLQDAARPGMIRGVFLLLAVLLAAAQGEAQSRTDTSCIEEVTVPQGMFLARSSPGGGTVVARVLIGGGGNPASIEIQGDDDILERAVRLYLGQKAKFLATCLGETVELKFTLEVKGEAVYNPPLFVRFRPPNHFVLVTRPVIPNVN